MVGGVEAWPVGIRATLRHAKARVRPNRLWMELRKFASGAVIQEVGAAHAAATML